MAGGTYVPDPEIVKSVARQETILNAIMYTGLAILCAFVLILIVRAAWSYAKGNGWKATFELAFVILGGIAIFISCIGGISKLHAVITAWVLVTTDGASGKFCHGVATTAIIFAVALLGLWIYEVRKFLKGGNK